MRLKLLIMSVIKRMKFILYENVSCPLNLQPWNRPMETKTGLNARPPFLSLYMEKIIGRFLLETCLR